MQGPPVRLGDVTSVVEDHQPLIGDATDAGQPGLMLVVERFPDADTAQVTRDVEEALAAMQPGLPGRHRRHLGVPADCATWTRRCTRWGSPR